MVEKFYIRIYSQYANDGKIMGSHTLIRNSILKFLKVGLLSYKYVLLLSNQKNVIRDKLFCTKFTMLAMINLYIGSLLVTCNGMLLKCNVKENNGKRKLKK